MEFILLCGHTRELDMRGKKKRINLWSEKIRYSLKCQMVMLVFFMYLRMKHYHYKSVIKARK